MESFAPLLRGSYGYLLIFQVLVISSLVLLLIWLIAQRVKVAAAEAAAAGKTGVADEVYLALEAKYKELEAEVADFRQQGDMVRPMQEKIRFLESKLLEYEILQEEIGTLGSLKLENEKLKAQLLKVEQELSSGVRAGSIPAPNLNSGVGATQVVAAPPLASQSAPPPQEVAAADFALGESQGAQELDNLLTKIQDLTKG